MEVSVWCLLWAFVPTSIVSFVLTVVCLKQHRTIKLQTDQLAAKNDVLQTELGKKQEIIVSLQEKELLFRTIIEAAEDAIFCKDKQLRYTFVNKALAQLFNLPPEQIIGKRTDELLLSKSAHIVTSTDDTVLEGKITDTVQPLIFDTKKRMLHTIQVPLRDTSDTVVGICGIIRDVTRFEEAREALRISENRFRRLYESNMIGIAFWKSSGEVLDANDAFLGMTGYSREELLKGKVNWAMMTPPEYLLSDIKRMKEIDRKGYCDSYEKEFIRKDGSRITILAGGTSLSGEDKIGITYAIDLTDRKQAQEEKKRLEEQLHHAEKMQAIGQLAGGIAHDFNNQLTVIMGYADMLREAFGNNPLLARYVNNILVCVEQTSDLTTKLLAYARKGKYQSVDINMHEVIDESITILTHSIAKNITMRQHLSASLPVINGDPSQMQCLILNIALNARDAMPQGGELIFKTDIVDFDHVPDYLSTFEIGNGKYLHITITDTGTGMDEETLKHLFEPFFTTKEQGKGIGMGLAAVYGIIKNHKGAIHVESTLHQGTSVHLFLPLLAQKTFLPSKKQSIQLAKRDHAILVVDDEESVCAMALDMLQNLGYTVMTRKNGLEAIEYYKKYWKHIDLVILDMTMPEIDGKDAYWAMRKINPNIKALLASGYSIKGDMQKITAHGVSGFIQKPFHKSELSDKIATILDAAPAH